MRAVIQRVRKASVRVDEYVTGSIGQGLLVFVGFESEDTKEDLKWLARKICRMRIFEDDEGKMNDSVQDVEGKLLVVSQFTLHASTKKGNRPSFMAAAGAEKAEKLYDRFVDHLSGQLDGAVETGVFGAMMDVELINDGPVTIWMDTKNKE